MASQRKKVVVIGLDSVSLPLVEHCLRAGGRMPALAGMIRDGTASEAVSEVPAYTPTNWATLATGARVGTTGAADWVADVPGLGNLSTFDSRAITAETIFEVCSEAGVRSLAIQYPGASPRRGNGMVVAPLANGLVSLALAPAVEILASDTDRPGARRVTVRERALSPENVLALEADVSVLVDELHAHRSGSAVSRAGVKADGATVTRAAEGALPDDRPVLPLTLRIARAAGAHPTASVFDQNGGELRIIEGQWSDWLSVELSPPEGAPIRGTVRFKLRSISADGKHFSLVRSEIYPASGFADPPQLADALFAAVGPFIENPATLALGHLADSDIDDVLASLDGDLAIAFEEADYQVDWIVRAAEFVQSQFGWDLLYLHWHFPDTIIHRLLAAADPGAPGYRLDLAPKAERALRRCLEAADRLVAGLRALAGSDGYTFVVSDHGNVTDQWWADIAVRLLESGLAAVSAEGALDLERSAVLPFAPLQLRINPSLGMPGTAEYERIQEAVIDALLTWKDPIAGKRVVALALTRRDAQLLGFWGPASGDVVFCLNDGFSWPDEPNALVAGRQDLTPAPLFPNGAHHGAKLPTARSPISSNTALLLASGPGIAAGRRWDGERVGWPRLADIAPTISHIIGIRPPRHSQGAVLSALFDPSIA
jgi:hypothetical protein